MKISSVFLGIFLFAWMEVSAMNPFDHDAEVIALMFNAKNGLGRKLSGPIQTITKTSSSSETVDGKAETYTDHFQIVTDDSKDGGQGIASCSLDVTVKTKWESKKLVGSPQVTFGKPVCK